MTAWPWHMSATEPRTAGNSTIRNDYGLVDLQQLAAAKSNANAQIGPLWRNDFLYVALDLAVTSRLDR